MPMTVQMPRMVSFSEDLSIIATVSNAVDVLSMLMSMLRFGGGEMRNVLQHHYRMAL